MPFLYLRSLVLVVPKLKMASLTRVVLDWTTSSSSSSDSTRKALEKLSERDKKSLPLFLDDLVKGEDVFEKYSDSSSSLFAFVEEVLNDLNHAVKGK